MVTGLSKNARTPYILQGNEESYGWDTAEYLLAAIANGVREGTFVNMQVRTKKKLNPPETIEIPGTKKKTAKKKANRFVLMAQAQLKKKQRSA